MNIDHGLGLIAGALIVFIVVVPALLLLLRFVRKSGQTRSHLEAEVEALRDDVEIENARTEELTELVKIANRKIKQLEKDREGSRFEKEKEEQEKEKWKRHYEIMLTKHNELVRRHNDLVKRFNQMVKTTKRKITESAEAERRNQVLASETRELQKRVTEVSQYEQEQTETERTLQAQIQSLSSEEESLRRQLAQALALGQTHERNNNVFSERVSILLAEIDNLRLQLEKQDQDNGDLSGEVGRLERVITELESSNRELNQHAADLGQKNEALSRQLDDVQQKTDDLTEGNDTLRLDHQALTDRYDDINARHEDVLAQFSNLKEDARALRQQNLDLQHQIQNLDLNLHAAFACLAESLSEGRADKTSEHRKSINPWNEERPVNIGLDFGTHSTKVVVRVRGERKPRVLFLCDFAPDYPEFAAPSLVRLKDGRLFFGGRALTEDGGTLRRSLKVDLLHLPSSNGTSQTGSAADASPDLLVALYLSWVLTRIKDILGREGFPHDSLNVAAPVDRLENTALKQRYLKVVHAAWQATFGNHPIRIEQGMELSPSAALSELD